MGSMGTGIAQALAAAGVPVAVFDQDPAAAERGLGRIRQSLERRVADGKMAAAQAAAASPGSRRPASSRRSEPPTW